MIETNSSQLESQLEEENQYHTYTTHRIPWFVRFIWICYWIGLVWYVVRLTIPSAKNYF